MSAKDFNALYSWDQGYEAAPWIAEFHGVGDPEGRFSSNGIRFNTSENAMEYANGLASRWYGQDAHRVRNTVDNTIIDSPWK